MNKPEDIPEVVHEELKKLKSIAYDSGQSIDDGIKLLVAALRCHGFYTYDSCYGHLDHTGRVVGPYVCMKDPRSDDVMRETPREGEAFFENRSKVDCMNYLQRMDLYMLIADFYRKRRYKFSSGLVIEDLYSFLDSNSTCLSCQKHEVMLMPDMIDEYSQWLKNAQAEMDAFARYLCRELKSKKTSANKKKNLNDGTDRD